MNALFFQQREYGKPSISPELAQATRYISTTSPRNSQVWNVSA